MTSKGDIPSVTLETKCWEGDYKRILRSRHLRTLAEANMYPFAERWLMINNVKSYSTVCRLAETAMKERCITRYFVVEEHAKDALEFFGLDRESLGIGYVYSIAELVSLYLCKSDFLLHFAGDCHPDHPSDWIPETLAFLGSDSRVKVANLSWICPHSPPYLEAEEIHDGFYVGYGFSDQCYMVRTADFRQTIYGERHPASARYPGYGGELFEKRVDSWMRNNGYLRATYRYGAYRHESSPRTLKGTIRHYSALMRQTIRRFAPGSASPLHGGVSASEEMGGQRQ